MYPECAIRSFSGAGKNAKKCFGYTSKGHKNTSTHPKPLKYQ
jgi:hypothetical protein